MKVFVTFPGKQELTFYSYRDTDNSLKTPKLWIRPVTESFIEVDFSLNRDVYVC